MSSLADEPVEKVPTCYCRIYPAEVNPESRQGDESHLPTACNPRGENPWARHKRRTLPSCREIRQDDDRNNEKLCLRFRLTLLSEFVRRFMNQGLKSTFLSCNLIIPPFKSFFTVFLFVIETGKCEI